MSIIGHELRTPLTAINGSLQLAQRRIQRFMQGEPTLSTEAEMLLNKLLKLLDQSLRQARVQNRLINDMLDISRLAIDKLELSLQPHNLIDIVRETVDDLRYTESYHTIDLNVPPQNDIQVLADSDRIGQVISNYITNALKYSPPDKPIKVWVELRENDVRVCVHDQGPGLSEEAQKHIWDRYYRANTSKEQKKQGVNLGLGLHICQVLIKRHHGQVGVESTEGEGSTFWFSLPLLQ
jgi:signal transduction histidine kinase